MEEQSAQGDQLPGLVDCHPRFRVTETLGMPQAGYRPDGIWGRVCLRAGSDTTDGRPGVMANPALRRPQGRERPRRRLEGRRRRQQQQVSLTWSRREIPGALKGSTIRGSGSYDLFAVEVILHDTTRARALDYVVLPLQGRDRAAREALVEEAEQARRTSR